MKPPDRDDPGTADTAEARGEGDTTIAPTPATPWSGGRELAQLAGRDLHADRSRRYDVDGVIGRGGMGEIFAARDLDIDRAVALKRMRSSEPSTEAIARFLREARVQGRLEHPAIVPVHDLGVDRDGRPFFTMKRVIGTPLSSLVAGAADPRRLLRAFADVCLAIEFAHVSGVVHRDLKPANIMLGDFGEVYVLDWGVARLIGVDDVPSRGEADEPSSGDRTQPGAVLGTPAYMSPEQKRGAPDVGPPSDVYALGLILSELIGDTARAPELDAACAAATADDPAARPSARELGDRVQNYLDGDRDAERRRALAIEQVALAQRALAGGDDPETRALAMRAAGRALALDPSCADAAQIVSRLILEPPRAQPADVARLLAEHDREIVTRQGISAARSLGTVAVALALLMWLFGHSLALAALAFAVPAASATHAYVTSLQRRAFRAADVVYILISNVALIMILSRLFGLYLIVPTMALAAMSGVAVLPRILGAYNRLWLLFSSAFLITAALEATGVWSRTTTFGGRGIMIEPLGADLHPSVELALLAVVLALLYAGGRYVHDLALANRAAQARLEMQAWHLRQLIPPA